MLKHNPTLEADETWWAEHCREEREKFEAQHSDLKPGQVVNAFLGRYRRLKTKVIIKFTPLCEKNELSSTSTPLYWVQRLKGDQHILSAKREDIVW